MRGLSLIALAVVGCGLGSGALADGSLKDAPLHARPWIVEVGARYWYSDGKSYKDLFDTTGALAISKLTYDDLKAHSGEIFMRIDHKSGFFLKGYLGGGKINDGKLTDEDFPPVVVPYSNTTSEQNGGNLTIANIDVGFNFWQSPSTRLGAFIGYHYWKESYHAYGCRQNATSLICVPTIPTSTLVISQENEWQSFRIGAIGEWRLSPRLMLTAEAAYLATRLDGVDHHHLRPNIDPLPEDGDGNGVMLEAILSYQLSEILNIGVGGRYWHLGKTDGHSHFELSPGGGNAQVLKWDIERMGVFVQGSLKFN